MGIELDDKMEMVGNYKMVDGDTVYLKVIEFPVPEDSPVGGESMWVRVVSGSDNDGVGILDNDPAFCEEVSLGDAVRYEGGTDESKPRYAGRADN